MLRKSEGLHGATTQYLHALERLFHLEDQQQRGQQTDGPPDPEDDRGPGE